VRASRGELPDASIQTPVVLLVAPPCVSLSFPSFATNLISILQLWFGWCEIPTPTSGSTLDVLIFTPFSPGHPYDLFSYLCY
jgi:hypothetical protein